MMQSREQHDRREHVCGSSKQPDGGSMGPDAVKLQRKLGLVNGIGIIVGVIVGSGIFVSPRGVLQEAGSIGLSLVVWILCGTLSTVGALCYAELGTSILKSGGDYAYIYEAFGPLPAFLFLWVALVVFVPGGNAISALTFANYILEPFYQGCQPPTNSVRLIAAVVICILTFINCFNVQWATRVQDIFTFAKVLALIVIIVTGIVHMCSGWNFLNFVTEELKDPFKNLPRAIYISLPMVTVIYVLANVAYFAVLTPSEILSSNAVAVTFGSRVLGVMAWVMPFSVALSTFGGLNGNIFAAARLFFVGAREGHLPSCLAMINVNHLTPAPSLIFLCILSLAYLSTTEVYVLINYTAFTESLFVTFSVAGLLWLRYKKPDMKRPIKVNLLLPIAFLIVCIFLVTLPFYVSPWETGMGITITLSGIPVYFLTIFWQNKPVAYKRTIGKVTRWVQILLLSVPEEVSN